jgi:uncharacterized membrane protein YdcZ (DUF606 family)
MAIKIQLRRGTAAEWTSANPTLSAGEAGFETDTGKFKIGTGATTWTSLSYATSLPADIATDISDAITAHNDETLNVHGIANTAVLETTTGALSKANTAVSTHNSSTLNVHGIANTAALETITGAQSKADAAEAAANSYTDSEISALVDSSPVLLDTLNELAAALNDDPNFATTVANSIATKATLAIDTAADWTSANTVITASTFALESDTGLFKIGNGVTAWTALPYAGTPSTEILAHYAKTTDVHGIANAADLITTSQLNGQLTGKADLDSPTFVGDVVLPGTTTIAGIVANDLISASELSTELSAKSDLNSPTFTGTVVLPTNTSIGNVAGSEIAYLDGVTSSIQTQLDDKLDSTTASTTYAPIDNANLTGIVVLPSSTSIGNVSSVEIGYVDGVTSSIQTQIDSKAASSDLSSHASDTTSVHGIADTTELETQTGAQAKADAAVTTANGYTDSEIGALTTSVVAEGTNLYYTNERAQDAIGLNVGDGLTYNDTSGAVSASVSTGLQFNLSGAIEIDANVTTTSGTQTLTNKTISTADNSITVVAADISDITASAAELNILDGITATTTELNYVDGVTSAIQSQIDAKAPLANATLTGTVVLPSTTSIGNVSATELGYVDGVTSAIQTQLDAKADLSGDTFTGDVVISSNTASSSTTTGALVITGGLGTGDSAYIGGDLIISGDFTVNGTTTTVNATDLSISDPLIYIGEGNSANSSDLGLVASFNDGTYQHAGLVRDSSDSKWKLFKGVIDEPTTTVNFTQGSLDALAVGAFEAASATIGDVSNTELQYLNGVTSAIQTQLNAKLASSTAATTYAPIANATLTGTVVLPSTTSIGNVSATELGYVDGVTSAIQSQIDAKAPLANATFTGTTTVSASGIAFTDATQTKAGVPSITTISQKTAAYTLSSLAERDTLIEINSSTGVTLSIPTDASVDYPVGTTLDILQTGTGQVTIAAVTPGTTTVNATPGLKLRTQWSSATLMKRAANTWIVYGDLMA